jgi:hypothetical protein
MNIVRNTLILAAVLMAVGGCGLGGMFGKKGVTNEQINADLSGKKVKITEGASGTNDDWLFADKYERCFVINEKESQISDTEANLSLIVSSWSSLNLRDLGLADAYMTAFGKLSMQYKKEGEKWVLKNLESKELIYKSLDTEQWKKFLDVVVPNCKKGFRHPGS